jgi:hypothetical protein
MPSRGVIVCHVNVELTLGAQDGVISRRQVLEAGETDEDIRRRLARREWNRIHPGVFVNHTGPPTWNQRAWAAVLYYWPAALAGASALHALRVRGFEPRDATPIVVCVDRTRSIRRRVGITVYQMARVDSLCQMQFSPPREKLEHALLDVASRKRKLEASIAVLADSVQDGRTTSGRLVDALGQRPKLRHRALFRDVLGDVEQGVRSVLEYRYLTLVERAHDLPAGQRQQPFVLGGKAGYPDVEYVGLGVLVQLDGRIGHADSLDKWADLERDLAAAVAAILTLRVGWAQVLDACRLASLIGAILQQRGWTGRVQPCGPMCTTNSAPGNEDVVQIG